MNPGDGKSGEEFVAVKEAVENAAQTGKRTSIEIRGARVHNLKNVDVEIPRNRLTVVTGVSGSGKSSLAFDTLYAEGQRRFVESLSAYARQFLERMAKPDVDLITGIPPAIAIEQKTTSRNPRSTAGTSTEVYDYLRLLFGRVGRTRCYSCGNPVHKDTPQAALERIFSEWEENDKLFILFPLQRHAGQDMETELQSMREQGFFRMVLPSANEIIDLDNELLDGKRDELYILADRLVLRDDKDSRSRMVDSLETAFIKGGGKCIVRNILRDEDLRFSSRFECAQCDIVYEEPQPRLFSFNNPFGACPTCQGFGRCIGIDEHLVIPNSTKAIMDGAIHPFTTPTHSKHFKALLQEAQKRNIPINKPVENLTTDQQNFLWDGGGKYIGINGFFKMLEEKSYKMHYRVLISRYRGYTRCQACKGSRLRTSARQVFVADRSLPQVVAMTLEEALQYVEQIKLDTHGEQIAGRILTELQRRLSLLVEIGLHYLTLDRLSHTLSGGESQRIHLATSIGSALVGSLYVLDEPSIGLHPRDTEKMIRVLHRLRNLGNTVVVVEHDEDIMRNADNIIDMGPRAGEHGGQVVSQGNYAQITSDAASLTGKYLSGRASIPVPTERAKGNGKSIIVRKPSENNLKGDDIEFPLGKMVVVTGVSGSGKSTLVHEVLYNGMQRARGKQVGSTGHCEGIDGMDNVVNIEMVDQSPIGKSPRSTPATYTKAFDVIRELYASLPGARQLGWKPGHFSFNVPGGRCPTCEGDGVVKIEMQFLADIFLECEECKGTRYRREAHGIRYNGKSIVDVLGMTVSEAIKFFSAENKIKRRLKVLEDVGLGYMRLGQAGTTLSGGEAQRVKLAAHMQVRNSDPTLFIFDEPTTGLHFDDVAKLLMCFRRLIERGHSLLIVEHNLDVMKSADWIIDLGPEGGNRGGSLVAAGTPEEVSAVEASHTGRFLRGVFEREAASQAAPAAGNGKGKAAPRKRRSTA